ncbi:MAG: hypothetical protein JNM69_04675 [Archangium sp.]|nr:hypothetical protein [Archangium sp.]
MAGHRTVTFFAPAIGQTVVPFGLVGEGSLSWSDAGLSFTGPMHWKAASSLFGILGFFVSFPLGVGLVTVLKRQLDFDLDDAAGLVVLGAAIAGTIGAIRVARAVFKPKVRTLLIPWTSVGAVSLDGSLVCLLSSGKPKGSLWFALGSHPTPPEGVEAAELFEPHRQLIADLQQRR